MRLGKYLMAAAAVTMAVAPAIAAPVGSLSASKSVRAGSTSGKKDKLAGGGIIVALVAAAAVAAGIVVVADNNSSPSSN